MFWESTPIGAPGEIGFARAAGLRAGDVATLRWTVDTANQTAGLWRALPADFGTGTVTSEDGISWRLIHTVTSADYASMAVEDDDWFIGLRFLGEIQWMNVYHFGGSRIVGLTPEAIATAGVDAQTIECEEGTTWSTSGDSKVAVY